MHWDVKVRSNLSINNNLIEEARRIGQHRTREDAVTAALAEYIAKRKRLEILDSFGTIDFDPAYDYKADRKRER